MRPVVLASLLAACAPTSTPDGSALEEAERAPSPPVFVLQVPDTIVVGVPIPVGVGGTLGEGEHVYVFAGAAPGAGPCPPELGGECFDVVGGPVLVADGWIGPNGGWVGQLTVPVAVGARALAFQAVVVRGLAGVDSVTSNVEAAVTELQAPGCTDVGAENFDPLANLDDGSCTYACVPDVGIGPVPPSLSLANAAVTISLPGGSTAVWAGDLDGDGYDDLAVGVPGDDGAAVDAGAVYLFLGPLVSANLAARDAYAVLQGVAAGDFAGKLVRGGADVDGDGADDLVVASHATTATSSVYVLHGPIASGTRSLSTADATWTAELAGSGNAPTALDLGDVTGDGRADLVVGAGSYPTGKVYAITGGQTGTASLAAADTVIPGTATFGAAVAVVGDTDGDGKGDLLVGAPYEVTGATNYGAAYLFPGPITGALTTASASARFTSAEDLAYVGQSVAGLGDVDGDGLADLAIGAPSTDMDVTDSRGDAYVFLGGVTGAHDVSDAEYPIVGVSDYNYVGTQVLAPGDLDGDGLDDLVVSAWGDDADVNTPRSGTYYVFHSPVCGDDANDADLAVRGSSPYTGTHGDTSGDLDGDGLHDLVVVDANQVRIVSGADL